jgi:hypothetical protein
MTASPPRNIALIGPMPSESAAWMLPPSSACIARALPEIKTRSASKPYLAKSPKSFAAQIASCAELVPEYA